MSDATASNVSARYTLIFGKGILGFGLLGGVLIFLLLTGLAIWLLPFSITAQMAVLLHTALGLLLILPLTSWLFRHWWASRNTPWRVQKIGAYGGFWVLAINALSGLLLSWEAFFSLNINHLADRVHLWSGIAAVPLIALHVLPGLSKRASAQAAPIEIDRLVLARGRRRMWTIAGSVAAVLSLVVVIAGAAYHTPNLSEASLPAGYKLPYGPDPFAPSMATTVSGHPVPAVVLAQSQSCGASGCHTAIYREAQASAHTWASQDVLFQGVQAAMIKEEGIPAARYCAGCHDPVSLLSAYKDASTGVEAPGFKEGDSCVVCHSMQRVDVQGNGNYVFAPPSPYLFEYANQSGVRTAVTHFLIRAYPWHHDKDYNLALAQDPVSCASCHKQFINKEINHVGWVQLQNQYDEWRTGKWNTDPNHANRLHCQDCHMYDVASSSPALADPYDHSIGLGEKHHNHWFAAANQIMPTMLHTYDAAGQVARVNAWLKGQVVVPAIAKVWPKGPVLPIKIVGPASAKPGEKVQLQALITNNKAGHNFATGPLDLIRAWIEVEVRDASGQVIFHSGQLTAQNHIEPGTIVIRSIGVNPEGQPILRHHLWHYVGTVFKRSIPPGYTDMYDYNFTLPKHVQGPLQVSARLRYRKANQYFMDFAFPGQLRKSPITDLSYGKTTIQLAGQTVSRAAPVEKSSSALKTVAFRGGK